MGKKEDTSLMTQQHQTWQGGPKTKHKKQSVSVERRRSRFHSVPFYNNVLSDALERLTSWDLKAEPQWKFHLSSFLSVIIASQLTNYRSVVFLSRHPTGEAGVYFGEMPFS